MYPEPLVAPMRQELTRYGVQELRDAAQVDAALPAPGTTLVVVNSVCGCAARNARPAVAMAAEAAAERGTAPTRMTTVFAGQDTAATERARQYFTGYPPSSPAIALLKDGELVFMLERWQIEGRSATAIAQDLVQAFEEHAAGEGGQASAAAPAAGATPDRASLPIA